MSMTIRLLLLMLLPLLPIAASADTPADWRQVTHGGLVFSIPGDWAAIKEREHEGQWGLHDEARREGVGFVIARERHPERALQSAAKDGLQVTAMGELDLGGVKGEQHEISGEAEGTEVVMRVVLVQGLLPGGDHVTFSAASMKHERDEILPVLEQVIASVRATDDLVATLTGYGRHRLLDGLIDVEVRNNWEISDMGDRVSWEPPSLSQGTVQPLSSAGGTLPRRCRCLPPGTRAPATPRRPSAPQLGVDRAPHPR